MATTKKVTQKPILESDVTTKKTTPKKSRKRVGIEEYAVVNNLRPEVKAGFKAWLKSSEKGVFHFDDEWNELFKAYQNRTL